ncbi:hypothetical protein CC1G_01156 [Coprinopsis cinerea okayama7|uniref:Elongin-A n=1 Tax=Coprinopsis cinerea (strain Okayama-7 / 130 / ATCC MYA-4618 / FGSC 9003) TaxID=240176 RepID=A8NEQ1_COPC7|nr:hypothetical protein CC1G_01156 [Coprinopsis cinerea okayama7\|eukprot:XP_001833094.2 hypothetical protein CC1G_01156 [Coprinopsis cinerea okayama7\
MSKALCPSSTTSEALPHATMNDLQDQMNRVPSLVYLCQRVAGQHTDLITSLGEWTRYDLVRPILEKCNVDQLLRLEGASPHLQSGTPDIWKSLCFQKYRMLAEEHYSIDDQPEEPDSWKRRYFFLQDAETRRFEEIGSKIRSQRMEADVRKKEREVRFTDRVPPPKRPRTGGWGLPSQPKTLFQKARGEASKIQKAFYSARSLPPMPTGKTHRVLAKPDDSILPPLPNSTVPSRVTVRTVTVQVPVQRRLQATASSSMTASSPSSSSSRTPVSSSSSSRTTTPSGSPPAPSISRGLTQLHLDTPRSKDHSKSKGEIAKVTPRVPPAVPANAPPPPTRLLKSPAPLKKDPMASLFVPKHRAYSQRPVR